MMDYLIHYILVLPSQLALCFGLLILLYPTEFGHTRLRRIAGEVCLFCAILFMAATRAISKDPAIYAHPVTLILVILISAFLFNACFVVMRSLHIRPFSRYLERKQMEKLSNAPHPSEHDELDMIVSAQEVDNKLLAAIRKVVEEQKAYTRPNLTMEDLCDQLGISRTTMSETINRGMGMSFRDYVGLVRIRAAKDMWRQNPKLSQSKVAKSIGFMDGSALNRKFKQVTKMTPVAWQQKEGLDVLQVI